MPSLLNPLSLALLSLGTALLSAQQYAISTYAGGSPPLTPAAATAVSIGLPAGIAVDAADNVFFSARNCLFRLDTKGVITRVAGTARAGYAGDGGPALNAQFTSPDSLAVDSSGNLYLTDNGHVRVISAAGIVTTVAGNGMPDAIAVDAAGNIYVADYLSGVRRISTAGAITTVAGTGAAGYSGDGGPAISAQLNGSEGLAVDHAGNLYIADSSNYRVRRVSPQGIISTFAGNGTLGYSGDGGPATAAQIDRPDAIAIDRNGNLYIAASYNFRVRRVSPDGVISTVYAGDQSPGTEGEAIGFGADSAGNVYLSDASRYRIRRISPEGTVAIVAGNGVFSGSGDGGPAFQAQLSGPQSVAVDQVGNLYIADSYNSRIRRVSPSGIITTVAGDGTYGYSGDGGPATQAHLFDPWAIALDRAGNLYIADARLNRVRRVSLQGIITTFAGGDTSGYSGDGGPATAAQLNAPTALAVDTLGRLYIADALNHVIRRVSTDGIITTVAGNGTPGFSGEGGPATGAQLTDPTGVAINTDGDLFIADEAGYGRISKVSPQGILTSVAGLGDIGGPPRSRQSPYPNAVAVDYFGNAYFTDTYNARVRRISAEGTIVTIAGNGSTGYSGDGGPATLAQLFNPIGLAVDGAGRVYIADSLEDAVRLLQPIPPSVNISAVTNGASNLAGPVSPGEIVVLYGSMLGPTTLELHHLTGTTVYFNGAPAPLLYTSYTQVAAIVPDDVSGSTVQVSLASQGQSSAPVSVALAPAAPALFTLDSTGLRQVAALNQDGSVNSAVYPAPPGSVVSLFATGAGRLSPVTVTLGGQTLTPDSAGSAPGEVEGLMQINVRIPPGIAPGTSVSVAINVAGVASQAGVTLAIGLPQ